MTKVAGVDVLLKVTDDTGNLRVVGGQTGATLNREAETIDTTDKTSDGWASSLAGIKNWSIDADGFVVLGNEAFDLIEDTFDAREKLIAEIRVGADHNENGKTYMGEVYIVDLPLEFAQDDAVTYSISLQGNGKLHRNKGTAEEADPIGDVGEDTGEVDEPSGD